jgi:acylphosphatase
VGFRDWIAGRAQALALTGWLRNRRDGSVEILASGSADAVQRLVEAAHQGPPFSRVEQVEVEEAEGEACSGFERRPTV